MQTAQRGFNRGFGIFGMPNQNRGKRGYITTARVSKIDLNGWDYEGDVEGFYKEETGEFEMGEMKG